MEPVRPHLSFLAYSGPIPQMVWIQSVLLSAHLRVLAHSVLRALKVCLAAERGAIRSLRNIRVLLLVGRLRYLHVFGCLSEVGGSRLV